MIVYKKRFKFSMALDFFFSFYLFSIIKKKNAYTIRMNLEDVLLNKVSQTPRDTHYRVPLMPGARSPRIHRDAGGCGCQAGPGALSNVEGAALQFWKMKKSWRWKNGDVCTARDDT